MFASICIRFGKDNVQTGEDRPELPEEKLLSNGDIVIERQSFLGSVQTFKSHERCNGCGMMEMT